MVSALRAPFPRCLRMKLRLGKNAIGDESHQSSGRWTDCLRMRPNCQHKRGKVVIGVLPGEGVGSEVIGCALEVLKTVAETCGLHVTIKTGGPIGRQAEQACGAALPAEIIRFCENVFASGGAILNGPGGGRYVYDLRKHFDLFFKISPLRLVNAASDASRLRPEALAGMDILLTRESTGGIYQGTWDEGTGNSGTRHAAHHFSYSESQVQRFLEASARLAQSRRGILTVVWKESGLPSISRLWRDYALDVAAKCNVDLSMVDIDLMAYRMIQQPSAFDVVAAPNLFGDVLADLGGVLLGSRGLTFSGNYTSQGAAVYQTNHGAAHDLAGTDRANPLGQVFSLAMMLRETFCLEREADLVERSVQAVLAEGWRTQDIAVRSSCVVGTREMGKLVVETVRRKAREGLQHEDTGRRAA
jgi:3-isopropylmalate dehydrogenase